MTTTHTVPNRADVPVEHRWNAESVFATFSDWEASYAQVTRDLAQLAQLQGRLAEGATLLADALEQQASVSNRMEQVFLYAHMTYVMDTSDPQGSAMSARASGLSSEVSAGLSFIQPEMLAIGLPTLNEWLQTEPRLSHYAQAVTDLFRQQQFVRSAEVENIMGMIQDPFFSASNSYTVFTNSEMLFPPATASDGFSMEVTQGTIEAVKHHADRALRRSGWEGYADQYLAFKNTLANFYTTYIKQSLFDARVRGYGSTLEAALYRPNVPIAVYENLIETYRKHLPTWHRYWRIRRRALQVDTLHPYDIWAPLTNKVYDIPYEQAVDWICAGLAPLGEEYVAVSRKGMLEERWVDRYANKGKVNGAFSWGVQGTYPIISMNYENSLSELSTLAHELGHSMHSHLTWQTQPHVYANYSIFLAEIASNFNQALVRDHLLKTSTDPFLQIQLLEEAMENFHRYFFIMPTLSRFEYDVHQRVASGESATADDLNQIMTDYFKEGYGEEMHIDAPRIGMTWAQFPHLYENFYVFQYATGISAAHALAQRILDGDVATRDAYLEFLKSGTSRYPLDLLQDLGIDMTASAVVEAGFKVLEGHLDRLEQLVEAHLLA